MSQNSNEPERFKVALFDPAIPQNTGNIARTCAATDSELHLVGKLGFSLDERRVRRAGLDYWPHVRLTVFHDLQDYMAKLQGRRFHLLTTKAQKVFTEADFRPGDCLVFGCETKGISEEILAAYPSQCLTVPIIKPQVRSLNLSTCVAIVLYEALRQNGYRQLQPAKESAQQS